MPERIIYLDHAATTALDRRVLEAMMPYLTTEYGNASSIYTLGRHAMQAIDHSREQVAELLNCRAAEIAFVGCGSESDNLALKGLAFAAQKKGKHIITTPIEHHAVLHTCHYLERFGFQTTYLPVDEYGRVNPEDVERAITDETILVSVMYANNEVGTIQPIAEIGRICRAHKVAFHVDAVQAGGLLPLDVHALNVDMLSLSAHKFYGPKGVGILYVRQGVRILPQLQGGSQERGRRAGTENVAGIVGAATAFELAQREFPQAVERMQALRDRLIEGVLRIPDARLTGHPTERLANNASFCFRGVEGESILLSLDMHGIAASTGSACTSGVVDPSHVLVAMGISDEWSRGSLRLTLGKDNTEEDVEKVLTVLPEIVEKVRSLAL
ncbi:cysteine desulfurase [Thermosporothrix hazakensis]|jgi:cysteine desulfurase|uniref:Cysteine desulfurase n=2 Tax=Thermosporothrix TaxID=768650 RepID=A0A326UD10_THEHA|nr:cysteine desulfurase NifS [Thermosporothrix hazakensis]PZW35924.1 cysteine desulfurase [Thermosporothrix hazakensis]BBH88391.1 cysteine desulfurase IscS [Thermosporothrix sp. COM3]GCE46578.1 cysteine desulfurase IscS [Thermosporothrix hazakensis]